MTRYGKKIFASAQAYNIVPPRAAVPSVVSGADEIMSYTYTHGTSPDGSHSDGSFNKLNGTTYHDTTDTWGGGSSWTGPWEYYTGTGDWTTLSSYPVSSIGTWAADGLVAWQNSDPKPIANMGSPKRPGGLRLYGSNFASAAVSPPDGFRVRAADDAAITTNVTTVFADVTGLSNPNHDHYYWYARLTLSVAVAQQFFEVLIHRNNTWTSLNKMEFHTLP